MSIIWYRHFIKQFLGNYCVKYGFVISSNIFEAVTLKNLEEAFNQTLSKQP